MRKDQVSIRIERFGDEVPKNYPEKTQRIQVYADANNLYEALVSACSAIIEEVRKYELRIKKASASAFISAI